MMFWILLLLLIAAVFGFGFTMQTLWWVAAVLLVVWIVGFAMRGRGGSSAGTALGSPFRSSILPAGTAACTAITRGNPLTGQAGGRP